VETVEKAAAAKIYLETYYDNLLSRPSLRETSRQYLELRLATNPHYTPEEKNGLRFAFYEQWSWHLRETRVLRCRSTRAASGFSDGPYSEDYEALKILGKGSFGVVKLVKEKPMAENAFRKQVFAMKVIRKADMLRSSQEGHLRAERDLLVASEGSNW
jgi:serine/threonine protein kinase